MNTFYVVVLLCFAFPSMLFADEQLEVTHYQSHSRYAYGAEILNLALSKLNTRYKVRAITSNNKNLNEARGEIEVIAGNIDLQWISTSTEREAKMIPIKIPLYQGMLGLRLLLVNNLNHQAHSTIKSLLALQKLKGGHGLHWGDLPVYAANDLPVLAHKHYDSIFTLLKLGRIDYFHRGLNEIWGELAAHKDDLKIADNIMLYYPLPVYFFVTKNKPELAEQLTLGIELALEDGSFKALFDDTVGTYVKKGNLENRSLIILRNPSFPVNTPYIKTDWWLPEKFDSQMRESFFAYNK